MRISDWSSDVCSSDLRVVGARHGSPLVVGCGTNENFLASDALALAGTTDQIMYLEDGDVVDLQLARVWVVDIDGRPAEREVHTVHVHTGAAELGRAACRDRVCQSE